MSRKELHKIKDFGKTVKKELIEREQTQEWLIEKVNEKTGLKMDAPYMSKVLKGERTPPKVIDAINELLELDKENDGRNTYEEPQVCNQ